MFGTEKVTILVRYEGDNKRVRKVDEKRWICTPHTI